MNQLFNGKLKYLFLVPIAMLIGFLLFFQYAMADIRQQFFDEKVNDKALSLTMISRAVHSQLEKNGDWGIYDYPRHIDAMLAELDGTAAAFAAQYDSELSILSENPAAPGYEGFDPMQFPIFVGSVMISERGSVDLLHEGGDRVESIRLHYLWLPEDTSLENRSLLVVGVGEGSATDFHNWLVVGVMLLIGLTFAINAAFVLSLCYLANTCETRVGLRRRA